MDNLERMFNCTQLNRKIISKMPEEALELDQKVPSGKRGTVTESVGPSIAARSGLSVGSEVAKPMPDTVKVAKDVRDQLKTTDLPYSLKNKIITATREMEVLVSCYKVLSPYMRRTVVDLRHAIKKKTKLPDEKQVLVEDQFLIFMDQFERVKSKKYQILETAEARKVAVDRKRKLFQVFIDDYVRICSVEKSVDLTSKMGETQKFKRLIKELEKMGNMRNFSPAIKEELSDLATHLYSTMALDGVNALKARHDVVHLRNAVVKGPEAEKEVKQRLRNMKGNMNAITNLCEMKRDKIENYVNDVTKMMLEMDKEINVKKATLHSQAGKDQTK